MLNNANDREFPNEQDRIAAQFVMTKGAWVSESRVGWNKTYLARLDAFLSTIGPNTPAGDPAVRPARGQTSTSAACSRRRMPKSGTWRGTTYSFEQKFSRGFQRHLVKAGFRFMRETGGRSESGDSEVHLQQLRRCAREHSDDAESRRTAPRRTASHMDNYSAFIQDDWRLGSRLRAEPRPAVRLLRHRQGDSRRRRSKSRSSTTKIRPICGKLDFGPLRDPLEPYDPDTIELRAAEPVSRGR